VILEQNMMRLEKRFLNRSRDKNFLTIEQAVKKFTIGLGEFTPVNIIGEQVIEVELDVLVPYIDWTPF
jgi:5-methyltetrahydrofolate--homocysteine methyltransferase